jgi:serine/threonine-protein kinase
MRATHARSIEVRGIRGGSVADPRERPDVPDTGPPSSETITEDGTALGPAEARIGAYRVLKLVGTGGMGDVFLAFDGRLQRRVAIKRLRSDASVTPRARERLRREAEAAAAFSHPAIVQVYDIVSDASGDAIVMEYVQGETLDALCSRGPLPPRQVAAIGRQVAEGLAAAHAVGLIHRDLKTQNVMLTPSGQARILDFGLAKRLEPLPSDQALTAEGSLLGTVPSMSPEQAQGRPLDGRSDLFSLGVLLYEIGTGQPPFRGENPTETLLNLIGRPPRPIREVNPGIPSRLAHLVDQLLEKDPGRRPPSASDVAARLAEMEARLGSEASEYDAAGPRGDVATIEDSPLPGSRRRSMVIAAVAALGLVATIVATTALRRRGAASVPTAVLVAEASLASTAPDERTRFAAFAVREAVVRTLAGLEGVEPVAPEELPASPLPLQDTARWVAADEVVVPALDCGGATCRVSLRRQRAGDAHVLASSRPFDVSSEPEEALGLTSAVALGVREVYAGHAPRGPAASLELRSADFEQYLSLRRRASAGQVLGAADVDELERIAQSSPGLTDARVLAASAARAGKDRPRALRVLQGGSPEDQLDPRLLHQRFLLELETGRITDAERALSALEARVPGDLRVLRGRAQLLILQGRLAEAAEVRRHVLRQRPTWRNLWFLADVETEVGDEKAARGHLRQLLAISPGNPRGRAKLAELEWFLGDPAEAVRLYEGLLGEHETQENVANLGWSRLLAGDHGGAAEAYRRALELRPADLRARLNLGIALQGMGDDAGAHQAYRELIDRASARASAATASERLLEAQALARVGRKVEAVELTMRALNEGQRGRQEVFQAALIYAMCGDTNHALVLARDARQRGLSRSWFRIPGFETMRGVPGFQELLAPS